MPEVCEVALTAEILNTKLKNKTLKNIKLLSGRYTKTSPKGFDELNFPYTIKSVDSKGKFLYFILENEEIMYIWNTFGMTGYWSFEKNNHTRILFKIDDIKLYYNDPRNFGTFIFNDNENALKKKLLSLSPDFLKDDDFELEKLKKVNKNITEVLMSQKYGSGLGNYLTSEILYRAKISPYQICKKMTNEQLEKLEKSIKYLTKKCYLKNNFQYLKLNYKPKHNYHKNINVDNTEFEYKVYQMNHDKYGNIVKKDEIVKGRTMHWVPNVQKIVN